MPSRMLPACPEGRLKPSAAVGKVPEPRGSPVGPLLLPDALALSQAWAGRSQQPRPQPSPTVPAMQPPEDLPWALPTRPDVDGEWLQCQL